ncbi:DUF2786 domain-containing protein [Rhodococcus triatomae]|uniref:DUF2786 domain-containing protein n=1 Tax=Rhodococcus triatomae TaxID=300028 RepID=UPI000933976B|nr:DUF2786 domain-containing protein [Rhodococcus triatomae]QNG20624.1 DUF2786 domain-containing protein [Rhodococcus triatomae]QNG23458.1 DUF2786 domain-containing protein [Rhodococcus triatomae]
MSSEKMLTRIGGLLRQAESTDNEHESAAFMAAAQRLATASSIDLAVARAHATGREQRVTPTQRLVHIGEPGKRGLRTYAQLFLVIAAANDVQCDIAQTSAVVYAYGFAADIDVCEALYTSLLVQMVRASDTYIKSGTYRSETTVRTVVERRGGRRVTSRVRRPVAAVTARLNFQTAYAARIGQRLADAKQEAQTEAVSAPETSAETALVLRGKELELRDYYREHSTARGTWRGVKATAGHSSDARRAGDRAARTARLGNSPELPSPRGRIGS